MNEIFTLTTLCSDYRTQEFQKTSTDIFQIIDKIFEMQTGSEGDFDIFVTINNETIPCKKWREQTNGTHQNDN